MKFKILFLLLFTTFTAFSQTGKITYSVQLINDTDHEFIHKLRTEFELMEFTLRYDADSSYFEVQPYIIKDELSSKIAKSLLSIKSGIQQTKKQANTIRKVKDSMFKVDYSARMNAWKFTNETAMIDNYKCYKAVFEFYNKLSGKTLLYNAWYTPEIPAGYGPIGFGGLPGLILQLEYKNATFNVEKIILNPKNIEVPSIGDAPMITVDEHVKKMRAARRVTEEKE